MTTLIHISDTSDMDITQLMPIHPVRCSRKVDNLVSNFNPDMATPILVDTNGRLLNGTHRYNAFLRRYSMGFDENFSIIALNDLTCWVGDAIQDYLDEGGVDMYINIDHFWNDNWVFSSAYEEA